MGIVLNTLRATSDGVVSNMRLGGCPLSSANVGSKEIPNSNMNTRIAARQKVARVSRINFEAQERSHVD
jgi:hypothetical protein